MPPSGRGGVGNIQNIAEENARVGADLESNQAAADSHLASPLSAEYLERSQQQQQQYARLGRGGAGNYQTPASTSTTEQTTSATAPGPYPQTQPAPQLGTSGTGAALDQSPLPSATGPAAGNPLTPGRGGAGNYSYGVHESEERAALARMNAERDREELKRRVEEGVKETLAEPPRARLPGGRPY